MPRLDEGALSDAESIGSVDDIPNEIPAKHVEPGLERDVEAEEQLDKEMHDEVERTAEKTAPKEDEMKVSNTPSANGEEAAEEYEVEAIRGHEFRGRGGKLLRYVVKWKGYPESENTLEPEENLIDARDLLAAYHESIGGAPQPNGAKRKKPPGSRTDDASINDVDDSPAPAAKRTKRGQLASDAEEEQEVGTWVPKKTNWEDDVAAIQTVERDNSGSLYVYITFKNGKKTRVLTTKVRKHCPMAMLDFYEAHLNFE